MSLLSSNWEYQSTECSGTAEVLLIMKQHTVNIWWILSKVNNAQLDSTMFTSEDCTDCTRKISVYLTVYKETSVTTSKNSRHSKWLNSTSKICNQQNNRHALMYTTNTDMKDVPVIRHVTFQNFWRDVLRRANERPLSRFRLVIGILWKTTLHFTTAYHRLLTGLLYKVHRPSQLKYSWHNACCHSTAHMCLY